MAAKEIRIDNVPFTVSEIKKIYKPCITIALKSFLTEAETEKLIDLAMLEVAKVDEMSFYTFCTCFCQQLKINCKKVKATNITKQVKALIRILYMLENYNELIEAIDLDCSAPAKFILALSEFKDLYDWLKTHDKKGDRILFDMIKQFLESNQLSIEQLANDIPDELKTFIRSFETATVH
jgi:hypothetical protein